MGIIDKFAHKANENQAFQRNAFLNFLMLQNCKGPFMYYLTLCLDPHPNLTFGDNGTDPTPPVCDVAFFVSKNAKF